MINEKIAIVGLGYVGLPLAVAFGEKVTTIGFDINEKKLANYRAGVDPSGEVSTDELNRAANLEFTSDPRSLATASVVIVVVPTPVDSAKQPDLTPLTGATTVVAKHISPGTMVVFESTVFPGCTEEICVPILERESGLHWAGSETALSGQSDQVFSVGYSPERINPGDKNHRLTNIVKVVSADTAENLERIAELYEMIVSAGVYRAPSLKVAEAAKVIENTQRDLNIALMNELAMIFDGLGIDTLDVLEAAGTKWNFLPFKPGLVGGHCIGVDPYYLTYKAEMSGYYPQVVLGGRKTNDGMGKFIAEQTIKLLARSGRFTPNTRVAVLGLTFKEDCPDLRNSRVPDILAELAAYGCDVVVSDPIADPDEAMAEYGLSLASLEELRRNPAEALIFAVPHRDYEELCDSAWKSLVQIGGTVVDVKGLLDRSTFDAEHATLWRL
ncbi:MAG: nucleotide sugar dehydrogenase [Pseudomonadota bacterium]